MMAWLQKFVGHEKPEPGPQRNPFSTLKDNPLMPQLKAGINPYPGTRGYKSNPAPAAPKDNFLRGSKASSNPYMAQEFAKANADPNPGLRLPQYIPPPMSPVGNTVARGVADLTRIIPPVIASAAGPAVSGAVAGGSEALAQWWENKTGLRSGYSQEQLAGTALMGALFSNSGGKNSPLTLKFENLVPEAEQFVYHVTQTKSVPNIKNKGLIPMQPSNWVTSGSKSQLGEGKLYSFANMEDAVRWAAKMDYDKFKKWGTGKISIIKIKKTGEWVVDTNDPLGQASKKGDWLKRSATIKPEDIQDSVPFSMDMLKYILAKTGVPINLFSK